MNKFTQKILTITVLLALIWVITKFSNVYYSIPLWVLLFVLFKYTIFEYTAILICTEFFSGIDTLKFGPISIVQIFSVFILITSLQKLKSTNLKILSNKIIYPLLFILIYFTYSYFKYYKSLTLAPFNWLFVVILTVLTFNGSLKQLNFALGLFVVSISVITLETFLVQILFYPDFILAKQFSVGNSNFIGFYNLLNLIFIIFLYGNSNGKYLNILKTLFYFSSFYILFSGGRLNIFILVIFFISMMLSPIKTFWIKRNQMILIFTLGFIVIFFLGSVTSLIFRHNEDKLINLSRYSSIEDLKNNELGSFTSARSRIYFDAYQAIIEKPIFGIGFLSWNDKNNNYNTLITGSDGSRISMHSTLLQYWAETGIFGLLAYLLYLFLIVSNGIKISKSRVVYYYLSGKLVFYISFFMILGSFLDNYSLSLNIIHFVAAISLTLIFKKQNGKKYSFLYK